MIHGLMAIVIMVFVSLSLGLLALIPAFIYRKILNKIRNKKLAVKSCGYHAGMYNRENMQDEFDSLNCESCEKESDNN